MGSVKECTTKSDFDAALKSAGSKLVVVDFTAAWCGPCKMIKPYFEELAKKYTGSVFLKVDVDANRATAQAYSVSAMPTFVFIKNTSVVDTLRGADKSRLTAKVEQYSSGSSFGSGGPAFSGKGNTLAGGSVSSSSSSARAASAPAGLAHILQNIGRDNLLPLFVFSAYLVYVLVFKSS